MVCARKQKRLRNREYCKMLQMKEEELNSYVCEYPENNANKNIIKQYVKDKEKGAINL